MRKAIEVAFLAVAASCDSTSPLERIPVGAMAVIVDSSRPEHDARVTVKTALAALVTDADGARVPAGVKVTWTLPAAGGSLDAYESPTDADGVARAMWTPPTKAGDYSISVTANGQSATSVIRLNAGFPVMRAELQSDSVRFTRVAFRRLWLRTFDQYDNQHTEPVLHYLHSNEIVFETQVAGITPVLTPDSLTLLINTNSPAPRNGRILVKNRNGQLLIELKVVVDIVAASATFTDPDAQGVTAGEVIPFVFAVRDSGNYSWVPGPGLVSYSSDDPAIASVDGAGRVTGNAAGSTTINAEGFGFRLSAPVEVFAAYDLGVRTTLYGIPTPFVGGAGGSGNVIPYAPVFSATGASLLPVGRASGPTVTWYDAQGAKLAEHVWSGGQMILGGSQWYNGSPLTAFSIIGTPLWTKQHSGAVAADAGLVVSGSPTHVHAFTPAGDSLWSYPFAAPAAILLSPGRVFVLKDSTVVALDRSGQQVWTTSSFSAKIADETSALYGASGSTWRAYDQSGAQRWSVDAGTIDASAMGPDGSIILSGSDLRSVDRATGQQRWRHNTGGRPMAVIGNRVVVQTSRFLRVYDATTGTFLGRTLNRHQVSFTATPLPAPVCTPSGLLFAAHGVSMYSKCP